MADHDPIIWDNTLVTGIDIIDEQHRILVNTLNDANAKLTTDVGAAFLEQITHDLLGYALYHFETEEELMHEYGYGQDHPGDADTHTRQHREFSAKVVAARESLKKGQPISRTELLAFLNGWLVNHILNTDKQLAAFLLASAQYRQKHAHTD
ncbi:bacteriohemerythrin [Methylogaea oryzae]|uniref:Hemerythrin-like domain-containing protein n=1 Tax=Methylogaea oryzae TaxID=1295382 RepID=A0A8D4VLB1_9GAMM|nr:bacteriohemerythrin [Methylogaea oryzae]BBL69890.1 hypothetical protein MoryE10_04960 [Methylogaea oryzae]